MITLRGGWRARAMACLLGVVGGFGSTAELWAAPGSVIWADDFAQAAGTGPDPSRWVHELGAGGWGNNELQTYTAARATSFIADDAQATDGKVLVLRALKRPDGGYESARLKTLGKFAFKFGRVEARIRTGEGQGIWPAFWMLGNNIKTVGWPLCGEIDVLEVVGPKPTLLHGTVHGPGYSGQGGITQKATLPGGGTLDAGYHVYAVEWSPGKLVWSVDGTVYHTVTPASLPPGTAWVFDDHPFFLLLNLAVGGNWPGSPDATTVFPQELRIDYVRVTELPGVESVWREPTQAAAGF